MKTELKKQIANKIKKKRWGKWKDIEDWRRRPKIILNREPGESIEAKESVFEEVITKNVQIVKASKWIHIEAHYIETGDKQAREEVKKASQILKKWIAVILEQSTLHQ